MQRNDLVYRNDLLAAYDAAHKGPPGGARKLIAEAPAIDAVPVIRCRDCRYAHTTYNGECKYCDFWQEDGGEALYLDGDFYCAAGERKDEATPGDGCGPDYCEIGEDGHD